MKALNTLILLLICSDSMAQLTEGIYENKAGQLLIISNITNCCFEYDLTYGELSEWGCLFRDKNSANFISPNQAIMGNNSEDYDIKFVCNENYINIYGGLYYIGMECSKFGDSQSEKYTIFRKKAKKGTSIMPE
jgi:hypothetical protein